MSKEQYDYRLSFIALLTGFLLTILFQVSFVNRDDINPNKVLILDALIFSLVFVLFCFIFSYILLLMASAELAKDEEEQEFRFYNICLIIGSELSIIGLFGFSLLFYYLLKWYYPSNSFLPFIIAMLFLFLMFITYFLFNFKFRQKNKSTRNKVIKKGIIYLIIIAIFVLFLVISTFTRIIP